MDDELWYGVIENLARYLVLEVGGIVLRPLLMFIPSNVPRQFMIRKLKNGTVINSVSFNYFE